MGRAAAIDDLFGHVPQKGELPIGDAKGSAGPGTDDMSTRIIGGMLPVPPGGHTPDTIREQAMYALNQARAATEMPWTPRLIRSFTAMFPYWCEWLKGGEGDRLLAEFKAEMDRLGAPVEQVAPNWRTMWGLGNGASEPGDA